MRVVPITLRTAQAFIRDVHRHNKPPRGGKVFLGLRDDQGQLCGVAVLGRPSARAYDPERVAEITRTCTDGAANANSQLYGACRRIARAMGYERVITYTQADESGASLRAAGFVREQALRPRKNWHASSRTLQHLRDPQEPSGIARQRWVIVFGSSHV